MFDYYLISFDQRSILYTTATGLSEPTHLNNDGQLGLTKRINVLPRLRLGDSKEYGIFSQIFSGLSLEPSRNPYS